jgi:hypothetical protein
MDTRSKEYTVLGFNLLLVISLVIQIISSSMGGPRNMFYIYITFILTFLIVVQVKEGDSAFVLSDENFFIKHIGLFFAMISCLVMGIIDMKYYKKLNAYDVGEGKRKEKIIIKSKEEYWTYKFVCDIMLLLLIIVIMTGNMYRSVSLRSVYTIKKDSMMPSWLTSPMELMAKLTSNNFFKLGLFAFPITIMTLTGMRETIINNQLVDG